MQRGGPAHSYHSFLLQRSWLVHSYTGWKQIRWQVFNNHSCKVMLKVARRLILNGLWWYHWFETNLDRTNNINGRAHLLLSLFFKNSNISTPSFGWTHMSLKSYSSRMKRRRETGNAGRCGGRRERWKQGGYLLALICCEITWIVYLRLFLHEAILSTLRQSKKPADKTNRLADHLQYRWLWLLFSGAGDIAAEGTRCYLGRMRNVIKAAMNQQGTEMLRFITESDRLKKIT